MLLDFGGHIADDVVGGVELHTADDIHEAVVAKLLLLGVLGLVQSVAVDKEGAVLDILHGLADKLQARPEADGGVGLHLHELAAQYRRVVTGIAVVHATGLQVDESEEHGDEHAVLVALAKLVVQAGCYLGGHHALLGHGTEQTGGLGHEQRGGDALATDVAEADIDVVVLQQEVVEVATHLLGGLHIGIEVQSLVGGELAGDDGLLDVAGNA